MFHLFIDKTTPRLLIKHFCAQNSKPILFTLNLAPNKGKWVSHFEVMSTVFLSLRFVSGIPPSEDLRNQSTAEAKKKGLLCAASCPVLMFNWNPAGCDKARKRTRFSGAHLVNASGVQVQSPRGTSKQRPLRKSCGIVLLRVRSQDVPLETGSTEQRWLVLDLSVQKGKLIITSETIAFFKEWTRNLAQAVSLQVVMRLSKALEILY